MTVHFDKDRQRWRYDFWRAGNRYRGYCFDEHGELASSYATAASYQEAIRRQIPRRKTAGLSRSAPDKSFVYFFGTADGRRVKIGHASNPKRRLGEVQTGNHERLKLMAKITGSRAIERALHEKFAQHHLYGEWYRLEPEIQDFIRQTVESPTRVPHKLDDRTGRRAKNVDKYGRRERI